MYSDKTIFKAIDGISYAELSGEAILLDVNSGQYFGLNEVGAFIMDLVQKPVTFAEIKDKLAKEFSVAEDQLIDDVNEFLQSMVDNHLIDVEDSVLT